MLQCEFTFSCRDGGKDLSVVGYFHDWYYGMSSPNNRIRFVNVLKNDYQNASPDEIRFAEVTLAASIRNDLARITQHYGPLTLVGVPRSKRETSYPLSMMGLKRALRLAVSENPLLSDGLDFIIRQRDTLCTHRSRWGGGGEGEGPRPGLIADTCFLSPEIKGRDILLVDDIYTRTCGIDEDAIRAVLNAGAKSVVFFAVGYTARQGHSQVGQRDLI